MEGSMVHCGNGSSFYFPVKSGFLLSGGLWVCFACGPDAPRPSYAGKYVGVDGAGNSPRAVRSCYGDRGTGNGGIDISAYRFIEVSCLNSV